MADLQKITEINEAEYQELMRGVERELDRVTRQLEDVPADRVVPLAVMYMRFARILMHKCRKRLGKRAYDLAVLRFARERAQWKQGE